MTQEEKAKAYDEAVINCSRLWECGEITKENYEYIFPELKESEDEIIRKWLIELVEEIRKADLTNADHNGMCSEAIAWIEKQGEQNKSIKDRIQPKQEWTEEDENNLKMAVWYVENPAPNVVKDIMLSEWILSLKGRIKLA